MEASGLLASSAVVKLGLYHRGLSAHGVALVTPADQDELMDIIRAVKRGDSGPLNREHFACIAHDLMRDSVDMLLIACTELSVLADSLDPGFPALDALPRFSRERSSLWSWRRRGGFTSAAPISLR